MISTTSYVYKVTAGCEIWADVHQLPGREDRPAILWLHGGALILGDRRTIAREQLERYVNAGYTVIAADYRLAPEVKLEAIIEDIRDVYAWIRIRGPELYRIDPDRIAVIGHSAGGYLTLMTGFCLRPRPRALVSFYGYGDIIGPWYSRPDPFYNQEPAVPRAEAYRAVAGPVITGTPFEGSLGERRGRFYVYCRQQGIWPAEVTGHDPDREPEWFNPFCPVRNVTGEYPATMLLHGDQDTDVPYQQSVAMAGELERHGVEHEFITLRNRGHGFDTDGEGMNDPVISGSFDRVLAFLSGSTCEDHSPETERDALKGSINRAHRTN